VRRDGTVSLDVCVTDLWTTARKSFEIRLVCGRVATIQYRLTRGGDCVEPLLFVGYLPQRSYLGVKVFVSEQKTAAMKTHRAEDLKDNRDELGIKYWQFQGQVAMMSRTLRVLAVARDAHFPRF